MSSFLYNDGDGTRSVKHIGVLGEKAAQMFYNAKVTTRLSGTLATWALRIDGNGRAFDFSSKENYIP